MKALKVCALRLRFAFGFTLLAWLCVFAPRRILNGCLHDVGRRFGRWPDPEAADA